MLTAIRAPSLDASSAKATLLRVLVKPGETIAKGAPVAEIETEKAAFSIESPHDGTVREWLVECGREIDVGSPLATMETADSGAAPFDVPQASSLPGYGAQNTGRPGASRT